MLAAVHWTLEWKHSVCQNTCTAAISKGKNVNVIWDMSGLITPSKVLVIHTIYNWLHEAALKFPLFLFADDQEYMTYFPFFLPVCCRMLEYSLNLQSVSFSAVRTVRVLRPLRAINRVPSEFRPNDLIAPQPPKPDSRSQNTLSTYIKALWLPLETNNSRDHERKPGC